jgi:hypothetical protein
MSTPVRWVLRVVGTIFLLLVYTIWRQLDAQLGGGFIGGFLRGAVVCGLMWWLWVATKPKPPKGNEPQQAQPPG